MAPRRDAGRRKPNALRTAAAGLALTLSASGTRAQAESLDTSATRPPTSGALSMAGCTEDSAAMARTFELFTNAGHAYEAGDLPRALDLMTTAHTLSGCHDFLFTIASLNLELQRFCSALEGYREYLRVAPQAPHAGQSQVEVEQLAQQCETAAPTPEPRPTEAQPPPAEPVQPTITPPRAARPAQPKVVRAQASEWSPVRIAGVYTLGLAAGAAVGATYFALGAANAEADYEAAWSEVRWKDVESARTSGKRQARAARILGVAAGALVGTGVLLVVFGRTEEAAAPFRGVAMSASPDGLMGDYSLTF